MSDTELSCSNCDKASCALLTLSPKEISEMEIHTNQTDMHKGDLLLRQETPFHSIIYLRSGYVKEFVINKNGPDQIVQMIKPRSYIGLQSLFSNKVSAFSFQAISDVELCYIEQDTFNILIRGNGDFAREILIALSNETLNNQKRILGLNQKQIFGKVADTMLYMSEQIFENKEFDLMMSRSEIAQMIASTRESVTKALLWFHQERMIDMRKNRLKILNVTRLKDISKKG